MSKSTSALILVVLIILLAALGIGLTQTSPEQPTGPFEKITLGVEASILPATVWVAENQGYFAAEGLDVQIKAFSSGRESFLTMLNGEGIDISTVAPTPIMFKSFERQDFSIFATIASSYDDVKVITRKDLGIESGIDLKGRKIGTPKGTTGQFFLAAYLTYSNLTISDVEVVDIKPAALAVALTEKTVDAIVIWEPHAYKAQQLLQDKAVRLPSSQVYRETFNFMAMRDFTQKKPQTLQRFLRANLKAVTFIKNHKTTAQAIVAKRLNLPAKVIKTLWDDFVFDISLDQSLLTTLEDEARWAIANGLTNLNTVPDYLNFIAPKALRAAKPEAVTVIYQHSNSHEN